MSDNKILQSFQKWAESEVRLTYPNVETGIADPRMENIAWLSIETSNCIASIKLWDTGDYYLEILPIVDTPSDVTEFGIIDEGLSFGETFSEFFRRIQALSKV